jgi:methionyl-tRNA formyltransferase
VTLVVSQPPKPVGRKAVLTDPPVAARARELRIPVFQPNGLRNEEAVSRLGDQNADLFVVVAYGKLLTQVVLDLPRLGCLNVHGSLLPRWRGASPVQAALLAGDGETGVSIMRMELGLDSGPVYSRRSTPIGPDEDAGALSDRLARLGAGLLVETLPALGAGAVPEPQDETLVTVCPKIHRDDGRVLWTEEDAVLVRRSRAYSPWPGLHAFFGERRVKLSGLSIAKPPRLAYPPGTVLGVDDALVVACGRDGHGVVAIRTVQGEGRRPLPAAQFCRGERLERGELLT